MGHPPCVHFLQEAHVRQTNKKARFALENKGGGILSVGAYFRVNGVIEPTCNKSVIVPATLPMAR